MKNSSRQVLPHTMPLGCLYCGVDSGPVLSFFVWMIGAGLLGFFCVYIWGWINGKFDNETAAQLPLEAESNEERK